MHNIVFLNDRLFYFGKSNTQMCSFCNQYKETFAHFFVYCETTQEIWKDAIAFARCHDLTQTKHVSLEPISILINQIYEPKIHFLNLLCLVVKQKLYAMKCTKITPNFQLIRDEIMYIKRLRTVNQ